ncbi:MAG: cobalt-precorrin 5A hydrolase [Desulfovibrio sp.]
MSQSPVSATPTAVYAFTPRGATLGRRIATDLGGELYLPRRLRDSLPPGLPAIPFDSLSELMSELFHTCPRHVFIAAAGVAVRAAAPHLRGKVEDPAVVVLDQEGRFCISLLSGHLGGANALARDIAARVGAQAVVTTATDAAGLPALDEIGPRLGLRISRFQAAKAVSAMLLAGERPQLFDPLGVLSQAHLDRNLFSPVLNPASWNSDLPGVWVHWTLAPERGLGLHPPCLIAGVGCRRGTDGEEILELIRKTFAANGLALEALAGLASIAAKADEPGLLWAAEQLGTPLTFFTPDQLAGVRVPSPSPLVRKHMGVDSVCEAAALLAARSNDLLVLKTRTARATLAVAVSSWSASGPAAPNT